VDLSAGLEECEVWLVFGACIGVKAGIELDVIFVESVRVDTVTKLGWEAEEA
jgi:hypothetical protein